MLRVLGVAALVVGVFLGWYAFASALLAGSLMLIASPVYVFESKEAV